MQNINFEHQKGKGFVVTDYPNAEKVVELEDELAQELADTTLYHSDLTRAEEYLNLSMLAEDQSATQTALWKMAIITFMKCFGKNNARADSLNIDQIIPNDTDGKNVFTFFKNLRDKNIAHDDNPIDQCLVGAVINKADAPYRVEKIITMSIHGEMNAKENIVNLEKLIQLTKNYIKEKYDKICSQLTINLELVEYASLIEMKSPVYKKTKCR